MEVGPQRALLVAEEAIERSGPTIVGGYRYEPLGAGGLAVSREAFPEGGTARFVELSSALGGGFLFSIGVPHVGGARTALYRSATFTGELEPVALLPLPSAELFAQRSRVVLRSDSDVLEYDLFEGRLRAVNFGSRVVEPSRVQLLGATGVAIEAPLFGVLFSEDEGAHYRILGEVLALGGAGSRGVETPQGRRILGERGELTVPRSAPPEERNEERLVWLTALLERGVRHGDRLVAMTEHGRIEATRSPHLAFRIDEDERRPGCRGFEGRSSAAKARFVCAASDGLALVEEGGRPLARLPGARRLLSLGRGGLLASGGCEGSGGGACALLEDESGNVRAVTLRAPAPGERLGVVDGDVWSVRSERGKVRIERRTRTPAAFDFDWPRERELAEWFETFVALPEFSGESGRLLGFVLTRGDEFLGVRARLGEGVLEFGPVKRGLQRAAFQGDAVFLWGASGYVQRSLDGGLTYQDLLLPHSSGDGDPSTPRESRSPAKFGCSSAGCLFGRTLVLWARDAIPSERASLPGRFVALPSGGRSRWSFHCEQASGSSAQTKEAEFWGELLPPVPRALTRVAVRSVDELGLLAVDGPASLSWRGLDVARLLYREPFSAASKRAVPTRGLFVDATEAEQSLGLLDRSAGNAYLLTSADGRAGIFSSQVRERVTAFSFEEGGSLAPVYGLSRGVVGGRFSIARGVGSLVVGEHTGSEFVLSEIVRERLEPVARFPMFGGRYRRTEVVADEGGRLAVSLQDDARILVYPLLADRSLGEPYVASLGEKLEPCRADERGYVVSTELSVAPDLSSEEGPLLLLRPTVRLRVGATGACLEGLAARARGGFAVPRERASARGVPLVVSDFGDERVTRLVCR